MAIRLGMVFLLLSFASMAMLANSYPSFDAAMGVSTGLSGADEIGYLSGSEGTCNGDIGECIGDDEEGMMDSESNRRTLAGKATHISYGAMKRNSIPCSKKGSSYYGCTSHSQANPYRRGCSKITQCARNGR